MTPEQETKAAAVLLDVLAERHRQHERFGEQALPDGTGDQHRRQRAVDAQRLADLATSHGFLSWRLVLEEEVAEALAESDPVALRAELVQVAAVAVQWCEAIDRRRRADKT